MRTWRTRVFSTLVLSSRNLSDWLSFGIRLMLRELGCLVVHLWSQHLFLSSGGNLNMCLAGTWITQFDLFFILVCVGKYTPMLIYIYIYYILAFQFHSWRPSKIIETLMRQKCYFMPIYCQGFLWKPTIPHIQVSTPPVINIAPENRTSQKEFHLPTIHFKGICLLQGASQDVAHIIQLLSSNSVVSPKKGGLPKILQTIRPGCLSRLASESRGVFLNWPLFSKVAKRNLADLWSNPWFWLPSLLHSWLDRLASYFARLCYLEVSYSSGFSTSFLSRSSFWYFITIGAGFGRVTSSWEIFIGETPHVLVAPEIMWMSMAA